MIGRFQIRLAATKEHPVRQCPDLEIMVVIGRWGEDASLNDGCNFGGARGRHDSVPKRERRPPAGQACGPGARPGAHP